MLIYKWVIIVYGDTIMEQIILNGDEWATDECIVHKSGSILQIAIKKHLTDKLVLAPRDRIRIYAKRIGHEDKPARHVGFKKKNESPIEHTVG